MASFVAQAKKQIEAKVKFPARVYPVYSGAAEEQGQAQRELLMHSLIAAVGIVILLAIVFRSGRNLSLVLANLPFALVGGIFAIVLFSNEDWAGTYSTLKGFGVHLRGVLFHPGTFLAHPIASVVDLWRELSPLRLGTLSLGTLVGFVTLFGITMRNSIMMISHFEHLVREEGMTWGLDAASRGATERLVPIVMTALVTGLGLLPLAMGSGAAGREIEGPMAMVILGGLITSTLLNLLVLPTLALRYGRFEKLMQG